jgi:hypothetical protein
LTFLLNEGTKNPTILIAVAVDSKRSSKMNNGITIGTANRMCGNFSVNIMKNDGTGGT